jgi:hypothetical protein
LLYFIFSNFTKKPFSGSIFCALAFSLIGNFMLLSG